MFDPAVSGLRQSLKSATALVGAARNIDAMPAWEDATTGQKLEMLREDFRRLSDAVDRLLWTASEEAKLLQATVVALERRLQKTEAGSKSSPAGT
jgi:hypothetical protein